MLNLKKAVKNVSVAPTVATVNVIRTKKSRGNSAFFEKCGEKMKTNSTIYKILKPKTPVVLFLVTVSAVMLVFVFAGRFYANVFGFIAYAVSGYSFAVLGIRAPDFRRKLKGVTLKSLIKKYREDMKFRVKIALYGNSAINSIYALLQLDSAVRYNSVWFYAYAVYYALLSTVRVFLLKSALDRDFGKNLMGEWRRYRFCGIILAFINLCFGVIIFFIVYKGKGFNYSAFWAVFLAIYTVTLTAIAIINSLRYRTFSSPVISAVKIVSLIAAFSSVISLETAILHAFFPFLSIVFKRLVLGISGGIIFLTVAVISTKMIKKSAEKLKTIKQKNAP